MVLSEDDKALIKNLYLIKGYGALRLMSELPGKGWKMSGLYKNSWRGCIKRGQLSISMVVVELGLCVTSGTISNRLVCWQKMDIFSTKCDDAELD